MGIMTRPAGTAFYSFVDMEIMQVSIPISEVGQRGCFLFACQGLFVAHIAEFVVVRIISGIEKRGEVLPQYPEVSGAMWIMAARTVILFYRPVMV